MGRPHEVLVTRPSIPTIPVGEEIPSSINEILKELLELWRYSILPGRKHGTIEIISLTTGAVYQKLFVERKLVTMALIQNLSTEVVSLANTGGANGARLNPANLAGEGGGSLPVGNIDLSEIFFQRTTSGVTLAVYSEL